MTKRSDITTLMVLRAIAEHRFDAYDVLVERFPAKVVYRAFEREVAAGNLNYGVALHRPWLEPKGRALLDATDTPMTSS